MKCIPDLNLFHFYFQPCLRSDFTSRVTAFPDFSTSRGSPAPVSEDFSVAAPDSLSGSGGGTPRSSAVVSTLCDSSLVSHASEAQTREQAFRTEFNLIYTCSPLNANLPTGPVSDRHFPQSEGGFSTADSDFSTMSSQGLLMEAGPSSLSLYLDTQFGGGYSESSTSPHPCNPPQKKKASPTTTSVCPFTSCLFFIYRHLQDDIVSSYYYGNK